MRLLLKIHGKVFKFTGSSFVDSNFLLPVHGGSDYLFLDVDMDDILIWWSEGVILGIPVVLA